MHIVRDLLFSFGFYTYGRFLYNKFIARNLMDYEKMVQIDPPSPPLLGYHINALCKNCDCVFPSLY